jgi:hypothetical protein
MHDLDELVIAVAQLALNGDLKAIAARIEGAYRSNVATLNPQRIDIEVQRVVEYLSTQHPAKDVLQSLIMKLSDPTVREDACRLLAARTMQAGKAFELWHAMQVDKTLQHELKSADKVALYRGFLELLPADSASTPAAAPVATTGK